jgi:ABC-2 type transport system permease protein
MNASPAIPASAPPARLRVLRSQVRMEQRMFWRNHSGVTFTFVFPLLLLVFLGMFADPDLLVPGIAALAVASTCFQALCIQLCFHRDQGVLKRIMATPLPPELLVAGKIVSAAVVVLIAIAAVFVLGVTAFGVSAPAHPAALVGSLLLGVAAFTALAFALASMVPNGDAAPAVTNAVQLPMLFVSGTFYPVEELPMVVQYLSWVTPLYQLVEPVRHAWHGTGSMSAWPYLGLVAWTLVGLAVASRRFRWEPAGER